MASFKTALEFGVDGLEFDVHLTKDGEAVVCHDEKIDRTTGGHGFIKDLTLLELQTLDAGSWFDPQFTGERIPTLQEVLDLVQGTNLLINIELKTDLIHYPAIEEKVVRLVRDYKMTNQTIISSFNHYTLVQVSAIAPELRTGVLYEAVLFKPWDYAMTCGAAALHPRCYSITPETVAQAQLKGLSVNTWTVDETPEIERALIAQVDGIITNKPDRVKDIMKR